MENGKKVMMDFLQTQNDYITYLMEAFEVPETLENESDDDEYLLEVPKKKLKLMPMGANKPAETAEELQERADVIKQKLENRKMHKKTSNVTKSDRRKLKLEKVVKKQQIQNRRNAMKNEILKQERGNKTDKKDKLKVKTEGKVEVKEDPDKTAAPVYNQEGKLFFNKVKIDGEKKKKHGMDPNPKIQLQKLKSQKKKITDLIESGDKVKAKEVKQKILWKAAFEKTEGVKVKDNVEILKKNIKKKQQAKDKTKKEWTVRKKDVEDKQAARQKKREDNLNKRIADNKKTKNKKSIKYGRMIAGVSC
ncbi:unnamed protein product [Diamesa hyperborea]